MVKDFSWGVMSVMYLFDFFTSPGTFLGMITCIPFRCSCFFGGGGLHWGTELLTHTTMVHLTGFCCISRGLAQSKQIPSVAMPTYQHCLGD